MSRSTVRQVVREFTPTRIAHRKEPTIMLIDCDTCAVKGPACSGCVVTVLLGSTPEGVVWDETERAALGVLADSGLVPPLRLVPNYRARPRAVG